MRVLTELMYVTTYPYWLQIIYFAAHRSCLFYEATETIAEKPFVIHNLIEARKVYKEATPRNLGEVEAISNWRNAKK